MFSSLIDGTLPHHGKYDKRNGSIIGIIQHHQASTNNSGEAALVSPTTKKSANYILRNDGTLFGQVPEEFRAWTSGGMQADGRRITIEVQNETGDPTWTVSTAALTKLVALLADISKRNNLGPLTVSTYRGHREFAATACPGPFLWDRMQQTRDEANAILNGGTVPQPPITPPVAPPPAPKPARMDCRRLQGVVHTDQDNSWGPDTDKHFNALREASAWGGQDFPYGVRFAQHVVGTKEDGDWGRKSVAAHDATVVEVQEALFAMGFNPGKIDGKWGPNTEAAYQAARSACRV